MEADEFLRRMADRDAKVFDELMPTLRKIAYGACHDLRIYDQVQDDIMQDVAVKVFTNWQSFKGQSKLSVWVYSIARNRCLDEMRKVKVRGDNVDTTNSQKGQISNDEIEDNTLFTERLEDESSSIMVQQLCIQQMISELEAHPPARKGSMRMIDMLRWLVENSPSSEELSQFLGTSVSAAKERKSYILKHLRELCQKHCGQEECAFSRHEAS